MRTGPPQPTVDLPTHIANQRKQQAMLLQAVSNLRMQYAGGIFTRLAADKYALSLAAMAKRAKEETDPYDQEPTDIPQIDIRGNVDVNPEAAFSIHAANTLLFHMGLLEAEQQVAGEAAAANDEGEKSKIVLG